MTRWAGCEAAWVDRTIGDMARTLDDLPPRAALVEIARDFHTRGWMPGTAGNLSAREDPQHFWITASGAPKGRLDEGDFLLVRIEDGQVVETHASRVRPSAETAIHCVIYKLFPHTGACLHGHTVESNLAAARAKKGAKALRLPALEMIKGFDIWEQNPKVNLPLFENHLDVGDIAHAVETRFQKAPPALSALLVRAHGPTVWGKNPQDAYNRFETLDFILRYLAAAGAR